MTAFPQVLPHATRMLSFRPPRSLTYLLTLLLALFALLLIIQFVCKDYQAFLALGPGSNPSTFRGYLWVSWLKLYAHKNCCLPPPLTPNTLPSSGFLLRIPRRHEPRPKVAGIAPSRQLNPSRAMYARMDRALQTLALANPSDVRTRTSACEKHGLALFLTSTAALQYPNLTHLNETCGDSGEICHLHDIDASMHLTLHPHDAALVISHGWGERHPLAGCAVMGKTLVAAGFVMVYAPTSEGQIAVLMDIVRAAGWWVGGVRLADGGQRGPGVLTRSAEQGML